jgi:hypothetical protein
MEKEFAPPGRRAAVPSAAAVPASLAATVGSQEGGCRVSLRPCHAVQRGRLAVYRAVLRTYAPWRVV